MADVGEEICNVEIASRSFTDESLSFVGSTFLNV